MLWVQDHSHYLIHQVYWASLLNGWITIKTYLLQDRFNPILHEEQGTTLLCPILSSRPSSNPKAFSIISYSRWNTGSSILMGFKKQILLFRCIVMDNILIELRSIVLGYSDPLWPLLTCWLHLQFVFIDIQAKKNCLKFHQLHALNCEYCTTLKISRVSWRSSLNSKIHFSQ